jgi:hypothetical protein
MLSQMLPVYVVGGIIAVGMFVAAMAAEGRGAHILRLWLEAGRKDAVQALREEALDGDVPREPNNLSLVSHLGAAERRYAELDARRQRDASRDAERISA